MDASQIIKTLGGRAEVARATGSEPNTVVYWERRGRIPPRHFAVLVALAESKNTTEITLSVLGEQWASPSPITADPQPSAA